MLASVSPLPGVLRTSCGPAPALWPPAPPPPPGPLAPPPAPPAPKLRSSALQPAAPIRPQSAVNASTWNRVVMTILMLRILPSTPSIRV